MSVDKCYPGLDFVILQNNKLNKNVSCACYLVWLYLIYECTSCVLSKYEMSRNNTYYVKSKPGSIHCKKLESQKGPIKLPVMIARREKLFNIENISTANATVTHVIESSGLRTQINTNYIILFFEDPYWKYCYFNLLFHKSYYILSIEIV